MAVSVLMLQALASKCCASSSAAEQESARTHIGCPPDHVADALEPEHRVINEKRDRIDAVIGVRAPGSDERAYGTRLGDAFLENLAVFRFLVIKERIHIHRFVELADTRINS